MKLIGASSLVKTSEMITRNEECTSFHGLSPALGTRGSQTGVGTWDGSALQIQNSNRFDCINILMALDMFPT